jgi:hypothetical protein
MDETETALREVGGGTREYAWFAIALLCIVALVVLNSRA